MTRDSGWVIQCDFDGTISLRDVTDALLERFGRPGWLDLEARWVAGEIGSAECMAGQVALLEASPAELDGFLDGLAIDPHFAAFAAAARRLSIPLEVVSDGLDHVIRRILQRHGLSGFTVLANHLVQAGERQWRLTSPHAAAACVGACGTCKCALLANQAQGRRKTLLVGDGRSDFCVAGQADFVLAKGKLVDYCVRHGIAHAEFDTFEDALARMLETVEHPRVRA